MGQDGALPPARGGAAVTGHAIAFVLLCVLLFVLPLLPALLELRQKRDAAPLKVVREYDGNIKHFANGFRQFLGQRFPGLIPDCAAPAGGPPPAMDPASYQMAAGDGSASFTPAELAAHASARLLIGTGQLRLGAGMFYEKEVYAGADLLGGERNSFRAILAHGDIRLGDDCSVLRWAHSDGTLALGQRARLYGRVSAECAIVLERGSRFGRMWAPHIGFGPAPLPAAIEPALRARHPLAEPGDILDQSELRWLVSGALTVPADAVHHGDLVSRKGVSVGDHASLQGNLKSNGDMVIGDDVHIDGALVATGRLQIGRGCMIRGPVVCDGQVVIGSGTVIGRADLPTTVTANEIRVEEGVQAHGTVWARDVGVVMPLRVAQG